MNASDAEGLIDELCTAVARRSVASSQTRATKARHVQLSSWAAVSIAAGAGFMIGAVIGRELRRSKPADGA
ncbi:MAG TPA: hypothetical protein VHK24_14480 [Steroidobacter sp.]|jgi:ElaB/YqjD/DUF883 family membrane-anchored ribosome-binding protein|nr:hypothetical protein [Steroidobacter sp.]